MPRKFKQTTASKQSAKLFGKAVQIGSILRKGLWELLPDSKDRSMMRRLESTIRQWLSSEKIGKKSGFLPLLPFEFSETSEIHYRIIVSLAIDWSTPGKAVLQIPSLDPLLHVRVPAHTQSISWKISIAGSTLDNPVRTETAYESFTMKYEGGILPERSIAFSFKPQPGSLMVLGLALRYTVIRKGREIEVEEKRWMPAGIIGAHYLK